MKKYFILLFFILLVSTGCFDYTELNDMAIVSGISLDYEENGYHVGFEILNTVSKDDNQNQPKVYLVEGYGTSISEAFSDATLEVAKYPYLAHLKTLIIDEEIAENHVKDIIDFLIRDNHVRNIFYLALARDTSALTILKNTDTNNPVVSTAVAKLIDSNIFSDNIAANLNYEQFVTNIIDPRKDTYVSSLEIENGVIKLGPLAIFSGYNMQTYLTSEESVTFNAMQGEAKEMHFQVPCPNDPENFVVLTSFNKPKSGIEIEEQTVKISTEIETRIVENHCTMNFKEVETYESIQEAVEKDLKESMKNLMEKLIANDSDILKIKQVYYQKYKMDKDFKGLDYNYDAKVIINRNGLIFEVEE